MPEETPLTGGRVTPGVVRAGNRALRPMPRNAALQCAALRWLEKKGLRFAPACYGADETGRLALEYIEGTCPDNIGAFTDAQCERAARMIRALHDELRDMPGCPREAGWTVCHGDLSPCNFVFRDGAPVCVIDWDAAHYGEAVTDLAYAIWLWLDAGSPDVDPEAFRRRQRLMMDAYGMPRAETGRLREAMLAEARRVAGSVFPDPRQTAATRRWATDCAAWIARNAAGSSGKERPSL